MKLQKTPTIAAPIVLAMTLCGCATAPPPPPPSKLAPEIVKPKQLSAAEIKAIHDDVRRVLKDPESARFSDIKAGTTDSGSTIVCGLVNARNSYGGYGGSKPFKGILTKERRFAVVGLASEAIMVEAIHTTCAEQGLQIP